MCSRDSRASSLRPIMSSISAESSYASMAASVLPAISSATHRVVVEVGRHRPRRQVRDDLDAAVRDFDRFADASATPRFDAEP